MKRSRNVLNQFVTLKVILSPVRRGIDMNILTSATNPIL